MRAYELAVVLRADLTDEELSAQIDALKEWVSAGGGRIVEANHWGRRRLTYPIKKQRDGYYAIFTLELPPGAPVDLERNMRIAENVLRFLVIRKDE